jgi:hypothetical protein
MTLQSTCQICGNPLLEPRWRLVGVCGSANCLHALTRGLQARKQAEWLKQTRERQRLAETYLKLEADRLGITGKMLAVVVPANLRRIRNLSERRRRAFHDRLKQCISQAAASRTSTARNTTGDERHAPPSRPSFVPDPLLSRGCFTCKGHCCNSGQDHAYQDVAALESYMDLHPEQQPRHVLEDYLSRIPTRTYQESCVYQAEAGCVLPREMRSPICNEFYCGEIRDFQRQFPHGPPGRILYVAVEGTRLVRAEPLMAAAGMK